MRSAIILLLFHLGFGINQNSPPIICLKGSTSHNGACYQGAWLDGASAGTTFASFQGIRYAQPPIGTLRYWETFS